MRTNMKVVPKRYTEPKTLLEGKPYTNSTSTDVLRTFRKLGWVPPSEVRK